MKIYRASLAVAGLFILFASQAGNGQAGKQAAPNAQTVVVIVAVVDRSKRAAVQ